MSENKTFPIPVSYFSIVLGLSAFGEACRYGSKSELLPSWISESLLSVSVVLWLIFIIAYAYKWLGYRKQAFDELQNVIQCCFISLIPITTILTGMAVLPYQRLLAQGLIAIGIAGQLAFAAYRAAGLWRGTHKAEASTPIIYLPTVAAGFVSATGLAMLGFSDWGMLFFGAGVFSWLSVESSILQRLRNLEPIAPPLRPIIGIQLAPAFVGCATYLSLNGGEIDLVVKMLIGYGLLQFLFLLRLLPWIAVNGFSPAFWAFSFGLASMANVGLHLVTNATQDSFYLLGYGMFCFSALMITGLILGTLILISKGKFFAK